MSQSQGDKEFVSSTAPPATSEEAFGDELGRYRSHLRLLAIGISPQYRSKLEPSDVVQQTLLEAYEKRDQFQGQSDSELAQWLRRMLHHNLVDAVRALRRQRRDVSRERSLEAEFSGCGPLAGDWLAADENSPSQQISNVEQLWRMSEAIGQLPQAQQEAIVLHHLHGLSLAEVAEHIERTPAAVAGLLHRGLKTLRSKLT